MLTPARRSTTGYCLPTTVYCPFLRLSGFSRALGRVADAAHQPGEAGVFAQRLPVRVGLEPGLVLVADVDGAAQPLEGRVALAEHGVGAGDPVGHVEVGARDPERALGQLAARAREVAPLDEELRVEGPDAVHV